MVEIVSHSFRARDFVGGHVALDFANTVTARDMPEPRDWIDGYDRLIEWALFARLVDGEEAEQLRAAAMADLAGGEAALDRARRLREALYAVASARIAGGMVPHASLTELEGCWKAAASRARLALAGDGIVPALDPADSGLELIADRVAVAAIELLGALPDGRARICAGSACGWLFVDTSKGGRRAWCDMATCGNAAKSRRHYRRRRQAAGG